MLSSCDYNVVVLTETWLHHDIENAEISSDLAIFRCDWSTRTSQNSRGGGVLIAVKRHSSYEEMSLPNCEQLGQITVRVKLQCRSISIVALYLPPSSHVDLYSIHTNAVQHVTNRVGDDDVTLTLGDFNLQNLQRHMDDETNGYIPSNVSSDQEKSLIENLLCIGLRQVNDFLNVNGRLLDLVFVNLPQHLDLVEPPVPLLPLP